LASIPEPQPPDPVTPPAAATPPPEPETSQPDDSLLPPRAWLQRNGPYLLLFVGGLVFLYWKFGLGGMLNLVEAGLGLGFVIFIHELGHFSIAKWCDVYVKTFSIGFGPALPGCRWKWGETVYKIALFPLGGYVWMLGEGEESEEEDTNPRSFKNKKVGQRMAIISAGVIMNVILACLCFIAVYTAHGKRRDAGIIGGTDPGNVAWQKGVPPGAVVTRIGSRSNARGWPVYFDDLQSVVLASIHGEEIFLEYEYYEPGDTSGRPQHFETKLVARKGEDDNRPMVGVGHSLTVENLGDPVRKDLPAPVFAGSAAAAARLAADLGRDDLILATTDPDNPGGMKPLTRPVTLADADLFELSQRFLKLADQELKLEVRKHGKAEVASVSVVLQPGRFEFGDNILAATNPDKQFQLDPLPPDPRNPGSGRLDYYEFDRRLQLLAGQFLTVRVRHENGQEQDLLVPPAYHRTLGLRMGMGPISAVREGSPAEKAGVQAKDILKEVLLTDGKTHAQQRFAIAVDGDNNPGQGVVLADPVQLPHDLKQWAWSHEAVQATLTVLRYDPKTGKERAPVVLPAVDWDGSPRWRFDHERVALSSPIPIQGLGLTYRVDTAVNEVTDPAAEKGLQKNDVIKGIRFKVVMKKTGEGQYEPWVTLKPNQWAGAWSLLQSGDVQEVSLKLERGDQVVVLEPRLDGTWPLAERGLILIPDMRMQRANGIGQALYMGLYDTATTILDVYGNLRGMVTGRISFTNVGGPLTIGVVAYKFAGMGFWELIFFLGLISANLAVINFLPIPFLDGGHMVFLIYEKIRGRPAPETVQAVATWAGLGLLALLMITVIILDVGRWIVPLVW
jgi:regulator of sigma E protease